VVGANPDLGSGGRSGVARQRSARSRPDRGSVGRVSVARVGARTNDATTKATAGPTLTD